MVNRPYWMGKKDNTYQFGGFGLFPSDLTGTLSWPDYTINKDFKILHLNPLKANAFSLKDFPFNMDQFVDHHLDGIHELMKADRQCLYTKILSVAPNKAVTGAHVWGRGGKAATPPGLCDQHPLNKDGIQPITMLAKSITM
jgi:hypothetical protein